MQRRDALLSLLLELQALDRVPRSGYALRGVAAPESVSEHSFHLVFLAWALAPEIPGLDLARVLELALVHDLAEVRMGDLPRTAARYLPPGAKADAERAAARELLAPLGERGLALVAEYQAGETAEARFVSACDKVQLLVKSAAYEGWGTRGLDEFWRGADRADAGFAPLRELVTALVRRRAGHETPAPVAAGKA